MSKAGTGSFWVVALDALMSVKGLSLAEAREEIKNLNKDKEKTSTRLK